MHDLCYLLLLIKMWDVLGLKPKIPDKEKKKDCKAKTDYSLKGRPLALIQEGSCSKEIRVAPKTRRPTSATVQNLNQDSKSFPLLANCPAMIRGSTQVIQSAPGGPISQQSCIGVVEDMASFHRGPTIRFAHTLRRLSHVILLDISFRAKCVQCGFAWMAKCCVTKISFILSYQGSIHVPEPRRRIEK